MRSAEPPLVVLADEAEGVVDVVRNALGHHGFVADVRTGSLDEARNREAGLTLYDAPANGECGLDNLVHYTRRSRRPIAVFTAACTVDSALAAFRSGACGYLSKTASPLQLGSELGHLLAGGSAIDAALGAELARTVAHTSGASWPGMASGLTRREGEVFELLRRGLTNREIADRLIIGVQTVKTHAHVIYRKLGVSSRTDLTA